MIEQDPLDEALQSLREIAPPGTVRQQNRAALARALEERVRKAWWRESISMPLPVAMAVAAVLLISLSLHILDAFKTDQSQYAASSAPSIQYSESQRYVSGIGVIDRNVVCQIQE